MRYYLATVIVILLLISCGENSNRSNARFAKAKMLKEDTLNILAVGDTVGMLFTTNSCCKGCWNGGKGLTDDGPQSELLLPIGEESIAADPDCAGCSDYYYQYFQVKNIGVDTITRYVIPMGSIREPGASCDSLFNDTAYRNNFNYESTARNYIIHVK